MKSYSLPWLACCMALLGMQQAMGQPPGKPKSTPQLQYFVIKAEAGTFGYDIYNDGNLYIHQPAIPSQPGSRGFADTAQAGKVARLAMAKMRKGEMPPTISPAELKKLGIALPKP